MKIEKVPFYSRGFGVARIRTIRTVKDAFILSTIQDDLLPTTILLQFIGIII